MAAALHNDESYVAFSINHSSGSHASEINVLALGYIRVIHSLLFTHSFQFQAQVNLTRLFSKSAAFLEDKGPDY